MQFTTEDRILIKHYRLDKIICQKEDLHEVLNKPWSSDGLDTLIKRIDNTGGTVTNRTNGSGRPKSLNQKFWPPNSPDLNPVDYSILEILSQRVYKHQRTSYMQHLKDLLEEKRKELP